MNAQIDRTKKPVEGKTPKFQLPKIQNEKLSNGLIVKLVEYKQLPIVQMQFVFKSGSVYDPEGKAGSFNLLMKMLDAGTKTRNIFQISDEFAYLGTRFNASTSHDGSFISVLTLKKHLEKTLEITADILQNSIFPVSEFDRIKSETLTSLLQQKDRAEVIANKVFSRVVYGKLHPYGNPTDGYEQTVESISVEDLRNIYSLHFQPENAVLIVVGDMSMKELKKILEKNLGNWKNGRISRIEIPEIKKNLEAGIFVVDKSNAPQSQIRVGTLGVERNNPDYFALEVMNMILGGNFNSRINWNLREQKGYTYGARSGFVYRKQSGTFSAGGGFKSSVTDSCVYEIISEIRKMCESNVTEEELQFAKNSIIRGFPRGFETPLQIASQIANLVLYDLPDNYFNNYLSAIEKITVDDVRQVSEKYLNSDKMNIVIVGDYNLIKDPLEKLNYGKIHLLDPDGNELN